MLNHPSSFTARVSVVTPPLLAPLLVLVREIPGSRQPPLRSRPNSQATALLNAQPPAASAARGAAPPLRAAAALRFYPRR